MLERLIDTWLDSSSERAYQAPFCQMLVAEGHRIIHSTRHASIEFGKDIISIGPDGRTWAFQLKGNPGSRLTLTQFRQIEPQLQELLTHPVTHPGATQGWHRSFLVTNGQIDEEVSLAIERINVGNTKAGYPDRILEVISRGVLFDWALKLGATLWPSELKNINDILELMTFDGRKPLPLDRFHKVLGDSLRVLEDGQNFKSEADFRRHITSTALLVALSIRNFEAENNHYAIMLAWLLFISYAIAAAKKWGWNYKRNCSDTCQIARDAIRKSLTRLCSEAQKNPALLQGNPFTDTFVFRQRHTLVTALLSLHWFWSEDEGWPDQTQKEFTEQHLASCFQHTWLWGEAAIPQMLIYLWHLGERSASAVTEWSVGSLLEIVLTANTRDSEDALPPPYYDEQAVLRHRLTALLGEQSNELRDEQISGQSFYAQSLLHLLVRTNYKSKCKVLWPDFSRLAALEFKPSPSWAYCLWRAEHGENLHHQPPLTKQWTDLVDEARDCSGDGIPFELLSDRYLLMLFVIALPYRGTPSAIRFLGKAYSSGWFIPPPVERVESQ